MIISRGVRNLGLPIAVSLAALTLGACATTTNSVAPADTSSAPAAAATQSNVEVSGFYWLPGTDNTQDTSQAPAFEGTAQTIAYDANAHTFSMNATGTLTPNGGSPANGKFSIQVTGGTTSPACNLGTAALCFVPNAGTVTWTPTSGAAVSSPIGNGGYFLAVGGQESVVVGKPDGTSLGGVAPSSS